MAVSYNRLWKLLIDRKMSKADLRKAAGLAPNTMTKLRRDEPVAMLVLEKSVPRWIRTSAILWNISAKILLTTAKINSPFT